MKLLTTQKNQLFDTLERIGLSPSQFEFSENSSQVSRGQVASILTCKGTDFFYSFETGPNSDTKHYAKFSPGEESYKDTKFPGDWSSQLYYFETWAASLLRELTATDKWKRLEKEISEIRIITSADEGKFSAHEYEELKAKIASLKTNVASIGLTIDQVGAIQNKLDHLTEMAKDMNIFDWKGLFIGTIVSIVIQLGVTPDKAKTLWQLLSRYLLITYCPNSPQSLRLGAAERIPSRSAPFGRHCRELKEP